MTITVDAFRAGMVLGSLGTAVAFFILALILGAKSRNNKK